MGEKNCEPRENKPERWHGSLVFIAAVAAGLAAAITGSRNAIKRHLKSLE